MVQAVRQRWERGLENWKKMKGGKWKIENVGYREKWRDNKALRQVLETVRNQAEQCGMNFVAAVKKMCSCLENLKSKESQCALAVWRVGLDLVIDARQPAKNESCWLERLWLIIQVVMKPTYPDK